MAITAPHVYDEELENQYVRLCDDYFRGL